MSVITGGSLRNVADVDNKKRVATFATSQSIFTDAATEEDALSILTGSTVLTDGSSSAILVYRNDEDRNLVFESVQLSCDASTGGTNDVVEFGLYLGVGLGMTNGTGFPAVVINLVIGRPAQFSNTSEIGLQGAAITGGAAIDGYVKSGFTEIFNILGIIPKGASFAISLRPPPGNTSMKCNVSATGYFQDVV